MHSNDTSEEHSDTHAVRPTDGVGDGATQQRDEVALADVTVDETEGPHRLRLLRLLHDQREHLATVCKKTATVGASCEV